MSHLATLLEMHTFARPMGSPAEAAFIARYVSSLPGATRDTCGNWHVCTDPTSETLWSCHTDTVHRIEGRQTVHYDPTTGYLQLSKRARARGYNCLGADDTVGCFLLREMILAGIPGHYIFHYGEERGGVGSRALATLAPESLRQFKRAIALDRGGYADVITFQYGIDTCSQGFARALGALLDPSYAPTDGIYTDTYEYADIIPECTNVSVGYFHAHSADEYVDCNHVLWLLSRLLTADFRDLPVYRDPTAQPISQWHIGEQSALSLVVDDGDTAFDSDFADMDDTDLEYALADAEWKGQWTLCNALDLEIAARALAAEAPTADDSDLYLDPSYADIQRALYRANKANYGT